MGGRAENFSVCCTETKKLLPCHGSLRLVHNNRREVPSDQGHVKGLRKTVPGFTNREGLLINVN